MLEINNSPIRQVSLSLIGKNGTVNTVEHCKNQGGR
jgi:hypothetical protein